MSVQEKEVSHIYLIEKERKKEINSKQTVPFLDSMPTCERN